MQSLCWSCLGQLSPLNPIHLILEEEIIENTVKCDHTMKNMMVRKQHIAMTNQDLEWNA